MDTRVVVLERTNTLRPYCLVCEPAALYAWLTPDKALNFLLAPLGFHACLLYLVYNTVLQGIPDKGTDRDKKPQLLVIIT